MKIERAPDQSFKTFSLTITVESEEERLALAALGGCEVSVPAAAAANAIPALSSVGQNILMRFCMGLSARLR